MIATPRAPASPPAYGSSNSRSGRADSRARPPRSSTPSCSTPASFPAAGRDRVPRMIDNAPSGRARGSVLSMSDFDVVVLGAGPGGYTAAVRAAQLGLRTAVVEEKYWGGVCLNVGCIPSKALLRNAELAHIFSTQRDFFGIEVDGDVRFDYTVAFKRSRDVADGRVKGVNYLMKKNAIKQFDGTGTFIDAHTLDVGGHRITFDNAIIATGASARLLPGTALSPRVVTYEEQILTNELPSSIIIAGAGAIGVEFAYVLHNYGVKVTIVEYLDRMVPMEDEEVSKELARQYRKLGIDVRYQHRGAGHRRHRRPRTGHRPRSQGRGAPGGRQGAPGDRLRAADHRLRLGKHGCTRDRARQHRRRRPVPDQRAAPVRDRRRDRQADARARGRDHGRDRRRDDRRAADRRHRLRHGAAGDLLPAADRELRLHRGAGARRTASTSRSPSSRSPPTASPTGSATPSAS